MSRTRLLRRLVWSWPLVGLAAFFAFAREGGAAWIVGFFVVVILWPATLTVTRLFGPAAGGAAAGVCTALLLAQLVLPPPTLRLEPTQLVRPFEDERQIARHTLRLPQDTPGWLAAWRRDPEPRAYLYVSLELRPDRGDTGLDLYVGETLLGALDGAARLSALRPADAAPANDPAWYRLHVGRPLLDRSPVLEVFVRPRAGGLSPAGRVGISGGHSFRPTNPPEPSAFFDGTTWSTKPQVLLPGYPTESAARYFIELRLVDESSGRLVAAYY